MGIPIQVLQTTNMNNFLYESVCMKGENCEIGVCKETHYAQGVNLLILPRCRIPQSLPAYTSNMNIIQKDSVERQATMVDPIL